MKIIELKIDVEPHRAINRGEKTCEVREMRDRNFEVGDVLHLRRTKFTGEQMRVNMMPHNAPYSLVYTGHETLVRVTHILKNVYGLPDGLCVMSVLFLSKTSPPFKGELKHED